MARTKTVQQVLDAARRNADLTGSDFVVDSTEIDTLNTLYAQLYEILWEADAVGFVGKETALSGTSPLTLPSDFFRAWNIKIGRVALQELTEPDWARAQEDTTSLSVTLYYLPEAPELTTLGDVITSYNNINRWLECKLTVDWMLRQEERADYWESEAGKVEQSIIRRYRRNDAKPIYVQDVIGYGRPGRFDLDNPTIETKARLYRIDAGGLRVYSL